MPRRSARRRIADAAFAELKTLQADWRTIGPVKKSKSEQVWQRFRAAADKVFDRYRNRDAQALADRVGRRESIVSELEALAGDGDALQETRRAPRKSAEPSHRLAAGRRACRVRPRAR